MSRIAWLLALPLGGCLALDWAFFPVDPVDQYELAFDQIPEGAVEEVQFETLDGMTLYGVWVRQPTEAPPMVFFHGNEGNLDHYTDRVEYYWSWGSHDVFVFDYRGYGRSDGVPNADEVLEIDGRAAMEFVLETEGVPAEDIPWVALSLGASVAVHTNDEVPAKGVVLESMFATADHIIQDSTGLGLPSGWFFEQAFDNVAAIPDMTSPVFLIHGTADDFIDPEGVVDLYAAAPDPKRMWRPKGIGHADLPWEMPDVFRDKAMEFLDISPID